jgi:ribosomal 50S subunit-recycling heat shock protein
LKTSRIVKRRTLARELCDKGRIQVNGKPAKPGKEVKPGDTVTLAFPTRIIELEVVSIPAGSGRKHSPEELYRVKSEGHLPDNGDQWSKGRSSS